MSRASESLSVPSKNACFVLRGVQDTIIEERAVPTECAELE